jgi:hypothetical protein
VCSISGCFTLNKDRRLTAPDVLDPFIVTENPQSLGYRLVNAADAHLDRVFNASEIETRNLARLQSHTHDLIIFAFSFSSSKAILGIFDSSGAAPRWQLYQ